MTQERNKGFESAMVLWAIDDLKSAATSLVSCSNRLGGHADRSELEYPDIIAIRWAASRARAAIDEIERAVAEMAPKVAA